MSILQTTPAAPSDARFQPEFVTIPATGGDKITNLSRSFWYDAERRGLIRLVRVRKPGTTKPRVLLPVAEAIAVVRKLSSDT